MGSSFSGNKNEGSHPPSHTTTNNSSSSWNGKADLGTLVTPTSLEANPNTSVSTPQSYVALKRRDGSGEGKGGGAAEEDFVQQILREKEVKGRVATQGLRAAYRARC